VVDILAYLGIDVWKYLALLASAAQVFREGVFAPLRRERTRIACSYRFGGGWAIRVWLSGS
jgi:hypothetical protein